MKQKIREFMIRHPWADVLLQFLAALATVVGSGFLLQYSTFPQVGLEGALRFLLGGIYGWLNLMTIAAILAFLTIVFSQVWLSCLLCSLSCGIISIINYYVIRFHTMPLSFLVLRNFKTAMNVASSYSFRIDTIVTLLILGTLALVCACVVYKLYFVPQRRSRKFPWVRNAILALGIAAVGFVGYLGPDPIKPSKTLGWSWETVYAKYGYTACTVESFFQLYNGALKPEGYSQTAVNALCETFPAGESGQHDRPDIILILNETFYDLRQVTDPETDIPYLQNIETMDNLLRGYAVIPGGGGGTNSSEYELLTSNSLQLMPGVTPFNTLNLQGANSIVSHLNALGYHTLGTHTENSLSYSRGMGYPALGFQTVYFEEMYRDVEYHYNRWFGSDESVYRNLIRWYEEAPEDQPRFQYLLTIQNHGAWDRNEPEHDLVHTGRDYGEYTQEVNEFLTGIYQSDLAFKQLTEYYAAVDRPVIICMMGDHAPTFASDIADPGFTGEELKLRLRKTPLLIWANFPLEQQELGTMSMNMVVPSLLEMANVELSPYYRYILQLKEQVPVVSAVDLYFDRQGNCYTYDTDEGGPYEKLVDGYFCLEYQNVETTHNRGFYAPDGA